MAQLVQLGENVGDLIKKRNANVLVVFREESEFVGIDCQEKLLLPRLKAVLKAC